MPNARSITDRSFLQGFTSQLEGALFLLHLCCMLEGLEFACSFQVRQKKKVIASAFRAVY